MAASIQSRVEKMFRGDALFASAFVLVLWAVVIFVFLQVLGLIGGGLIAIVLVVGGGLVLLFNTAAIVAMIRHYSHEKSFIYGLDIRHLDEMRRRQGK